MKPTTALFAIFVLFALSAFSPAFAEQVSMRSLTCESVQGERQHCSANTASGILMARSFGEGACLLGKSWGYDDAGVWVTDGCAAEFMVAGSGATLAAEPAPKAAAPVATVDATPAQPAKEAAAESTSQEVVLVEVDVPVEKKEVPEPANETWGYLDPGKGFLIGKGQYGEASISAYALLRYMNQKDDDGIFTDHLGNERVVDGRKDIYSHRVLVWLNGWVGTPKLRYTLTWWTITATDQDALFANIGYQFNKHFNLYAGVVGNPGSRSMQGSHPYWLGTDRVMADEFFRPFFGQGIYANGEVIPGLWYMTSVGNSSSTLGSVATQLDREFTYGGSVWWMPTTNEFGPRGGYGDWEFHEEVATRFGISAVYSPEERYTDIDVASGNTSIKLADSVNIFETGALAPGVTLTNLDYRVLALDAGFKYKGIFFQIEYYQRWLDSFKANGVVPMDEIKDNGFYVQAAFFPIPYMLEVYGSTSQIYADESLGFQDSNEYILGMNYYPFKSHNQRLNLQYIDVTRSPVGSTFGYYVGGQDGDTFSAAFSVFF